MFYSKQEPNFSKLAYMSLIYFSLYFLNDLLGMSEEWVSSPDIPWSVQLDFK